MVKYFSSQNCNETVFNFMASYLQTASFLVHGETNNQKESLIFFQTLHMCSRFCVNFDAGISDFEFEFSVRTPNSLIVIVTFFCR